MKTIDFALFDEVTSRRYDSVKYDYGQSIMSSFWSFLIKLKKSPEL